jgi:glycogen synthase
LVIAHQTWLADPDRIGRMPLRSRIKFAVTRAATSISISSAIADHLGCPSVIIGNPFDEGLFRMLPEVERQQDLLFVGVLGKVKGVDVLLRALKTLWTRNICVRLTIVGGGPEERTLRALAEELRLSEAVTFTGSLRGEGLVREYNRHSIQVIPSLWAEPFGVIAVEGIACGCVPIGTANGGLRDAIGPCGMLVPNGDANALAEKIEYALTTANLMDYRVNAAAHLKKHQGKEVAAAYLQIFQNALRKLRSQART